VLLWIFLVSRVVDGVYVLTVPSVLAVVAEVPVELRERASGPLPSNAWVSRVSPGASKTLAKPGKVVPAVVVTTA
jgi:hypothetical protein